MDEEGRQNDAVIAEIKQVVPYVARAPSSSARGASNADRGA